jgi:hypothetical protein
VDDDAADRADVAVGEAEVGAAREVAAAKAMLARQAARDGVGEDGDGDEAAVVTVVRRVTDRPDICGEDRPRGAVVKARELVVVVQIAAGEGERAGEEGGEMRRA